MKLPNEIPNAAEFGLLRAFLASKLQEHGRDTAQAQQEISTIIGSNVDGQTRAEINEKLKAYFKAAPKG